MEVKENEFEDFALAISSAYNALSRGEVLDLNSFNELGVGLRNLRALMDSGSADIGDLNRALRLIDSGIQKITNIPGKMFTQNDFEWTQTSIVGLKRVSETAGDVFRLIESRGINDEQLRRTVSSIADAAQRKSVGLGPLADAMEHYFSTQL